METHQSPTTGVLLEGNGGNVKHKVDASNDCDQDQDQDKASTKISEAWNDTELDDFRLAKNSRGCYLRLEGPLHPNFRYTILEIPDPTDLQALSPGTVRFQFRNSCPTSRLEVNNLMDQLNTNGSFGKLKLKLDRKRKFLDVVCTTMEQYKVAREVQLEWEGQTLLTIQRSAFLRESQVIFKVEYCTLIINQGHLQEALRQALQNHPIEIHDRWVEYSEHGEPTGTVFFSALINNQKFKAERLPGWFSAEVKHGMEEFRLDYRGRRESCTYCRTRNPNGHTNRDCPRRPVCPRCNMRRHHPYPCPKKPALG